MIKNYLTYCKKINEAKVKEDLPLLTLRGHNFETSIGQSVRDNMRGIMNADRRNEIQVLINNTKGKKVMFYNLKGKTNLKKERISEGGYWIEDQNADFYYGLDRSWDVWKLMLIGTKKDYNVNLIKPIGYYGNVIKEPIKLILSVNPYDPYDEEIWD